MLVPKAPDQCQYVVHGRPCEAEATHTVLFEAVGAKGEDEILNLCEADFAELIGDAPEGTWKEC
jgi:hypothetical protein